jgi:hypothetical protein
MISAPFNKTKIDISQYNTTLKDYDSSFLDANLMVLPSTENLELEAICINNKTAITWHH